MKRQATSAIVGLGFSQLSRQPIGSARALALEAISLAITDAGLALKDIDGLLINQSALAAPGSLNLRLQEDAGLGSLRLLSCVEAKGASVLQMVQQAALAIAAGMARNVVCVFADAPLVADVAGSQSYGNASILTGIEGWEAQYGMFGPVGAYALLARRYMEVFGVSERQLAGHALACRRWAQDNPQAFLRKPLTMDDYLAARKVAEPFRVLDCAFPINGGAAVVVSAAPQASDAARPAVYIHGMGQGHAAAAMLRASGEDWPTPAALAAQTLYRMAGIGPAEVSMFQIYDAFSYCAVAALEDFGFCEYGSGAAFIADGNTAPGGSLPVNTGGGQLSGGYLQGMTPLTEAVIQGRGDGAARQARNDLILVNGSGGRLEYHAALLLSPHAAI